MCRRATWPEPAARNPPRASWSKDGARPIPPSLFSKLVGHPLTFGFIRPPQRHVSIESVLLDATEETIVLATELSPSRPVEYLGRTVMDAGYWAVWFLFKDRPFDVGRVYRPDGTWTGYYVDVLQPLRWEAADPNTLEPIVDLFLDLWIGPDGRYVVLDEDEFEEAINLGHLTSAQGDHARGVLQELIEATRREEFPPAAVRGFRLMVNGA